MGSVTRGPLSEEGLVRLSLSLSSFLAGAGLVALMEFTSSSCRIERPFGSLPKAAQNVYQRPYFTVYDRIVSANKLTELRIDRNGDGFSDEIVFFSRGGDGVLLENAISVYTSRFGSGRNGTRVAHVTLPRDLSDNDYQSEVKRVLATRGYPPEVVHGFEF